MSTIPGEEFVLEGQLCADLGEDRVVGQLPKRGWGNKEHVGNPVVGMGSSEPGRTG